MGSCCSEDRGNWMCRECYTINPCSKDPKCQTPGCRGVDHSHWRCHKCQRINPYSKDPKCRTPGCLVVDPKHWRCGCTGINVSTDVRCKNKDRGCHYGVNPEETPFPTPEGYVFPEFPDSDVEH